MVLCFVCFGVGCFTTRLDYGVRVGLVRGELWVDEMELGGLRMESGLTSPMRNIRCGIFTAKEGIRCNRTKIS